MGTDWRDMAKCNVETCVLCQFYLRGGVFGAPRSFASAWIWPGETRSEDEYTTAAEEHEASEWKDHYFAGRHGKIMHPVLGVWDTRRGVYYWPADEPNVEGRKLAADARARVLADLYLAERMAPEEPAEPEIWWCFEEGIGFDGSSKRGS